MSQRPCSEMSAWSNDASPFPGKTFEPKSPEPDHQDAGIFFATHDAWGILDTGATKIVMGSKFVSDFLQALDPKIRTQVNQSSCDVVFRFGNQGTVRSSPMICHGDSSLRP